MPQNKLIEYYNNQLATFRIHFTNTVNRQGVEDIHQLRVFTKRIRTILAIMEISSQSEFRKKEHLHLFLEPFRLAGELREIQLHLHLISAYESKYLAPYKEYLIESQKQANENLLEGLARFDFENLEELNKVLLKKIENVTNEIASKESRTYLLSKLKRVEELKDNINDDQKLHKIRIHLRAVMETLRLMNALEPSNEMREVKFQPRSLNDIIGKCHDQTVLIVSLERFIQQSANERIIQHLSTLINDLVNENSVARKNINTLLVSYLSQTV